MGLDITVFEDITEIVDYKPDAEGYPERRGAGGLVNDGEYFLVFNVNEYRKRAEDLTQNPYGYRNSLSFSAGGYIGYMWFRDALAKLAGYPRGNSDHPVYRNFPYFYSAITSDSGPFYELLDFTDSEGTIGTQVSRKLSQDFAAFQHKADAFVVDEGTREDFTDKFKKLYGMFRTAFETAAVNGAVVFS